MPQQPDKELVSWEVIGREIGVTGPGALKIYNQAMIKIRRYLQANPTHAEGLFLLMRNSDETHIDTMWSRMRRSGILSSQFGGKDAG